MESDISGKELAQRLQGYNPDHRQCDASLYRGIFEHKDELLLITRHGIGYNNIDLAAARNHQTIVSIIPTLERDAVAENNATNLLALLRCTVESSVKVRQESMESRAKFVGRALFNKTVGVIGGKAIQEVVSWRFCAMGFAVRY